MPSAQHPPAQVINLTHDFERYYLSRQANNSTSKSLLSYPPGHLQITDPLSVNHESLILHLQERSRPTVIWELESSLAPEGTEGAFYIRQKLAEQEV